MKLSKDYNLAVCNPQLAKEWHPTKNGSLTPKDVTPHSHKTVWWKCSKNKKHPSWPATINHRSNSKGCPYCAGRKVCKDNCLQTVNPKLAKEWHPTKNGDLTPKDVTAHSGKTVWWKCKEGHEWQTRVVYRSKGHGCRYCYRDIRKRAKNNQVEGVLDKEPLELLNPQQLLLKVG